MTVPFDRVREIFPAALEESDTAARVAYIRAACAEDAALLEQVELLLRSHDDSSGNDRPETSTLAPSEFAPLDSEPPTAPSPHPPIFDAPGAQIGPFKLRAKLGEGGMGSVWLADQERPVQRRVALKVIKAGMDSAHVLARFAQERQALALMDHPNIAKVLDAGMVPGTGRPYFIMEYVKGIPITRYCDQEHLTPRERLMLFIPVCQALQHAHQKGIIHRDLKPSNVLVGLYDGKPIPKVIDFGVAKATGPKLTDRTVFTEIGSIVGTLEYMAPEQAELTNLDIDTRADIYSLGVRLYELLTGSPPFTAEQLRGAAITEVLRLIREVEPQRPSLRLSTSHELPAIAAKRKLEPRRLQRMVHGDLDWIVMKCLEKERSRRYDSASLLAEDLQHYLVDEPVLAGPPSAGYRLRKFLVRNRGPVIAASLLLLALVGGVVGTTLGMILARHERDAKEVQRDKAVKAADAEARQRKHAEDLVALFESLFRKRDPLLAEGNADPRRELLSQLDRAAADVETQYADEPLVRARMLVAIAGTYSGIGSSDKAIPLFEQAVAERERHLGADSPAATAARWELGRALFRAGRYERALKLYETNLKHQRARLGENHFDVLSTRFEIANTYIEIGQAREALKLLEPLLEEVTKQLGPDHHLANRVSHSLALTFHGLGKRTAALPLLEAAVKRFAATVGPDHPTTLGAMRGLGMALLNDGRKMEALRMFQDVLAKAQARLGKDHPTTLAYQADVGIGLLHSGGIHLAVSTLENTLQLQQVKLGHHHRDTISTQGELASVYLYSGRQERAVALLEEVVQHQQQDLGTNHSSTLTSMNNLATAYTMNGQAEKALPLAEKTLPLTVAKYGPDHPETLTLEQNRAAAMFRLGQRERGLQLYDDAYRRRLKVFGPKHVTSIQAEMWIGSAYRVLGRMDKAIATMESALAKTPRMPNNVPLELGAVVPTLADVYDEAKQYAKAEPFHRETVQMANLAFGPDNAYAALRAALFGDNLLAQRKFVEAEVVLRDVLQVRLKLQPELWNTFNTKSILGAALLEQKKYADAEPLLLEGYAGMKKHEASIPVPSKRRLREGAERIARLYSATKRPEEAARWRKLATENQEAAK